MSADGSVLIWNKKLFKQAGLDPEKGPTTWAEIEQDAEKVNALGNGVSGFYFSGACGGCNAFTFMPLVWASGGEILVGRRQEGDARHAADARRHRLLSRHDRQGPRSRKRQDRHRRPTSSAALPPTISASSPIGAFAIGDLVKNYPGHRFRRHLPARQGRRLAVLRRRRQLRGHGRARQPRRRQRTSSSSSIRSKARPCLPSWAACRPAPMSPRKR